MRFVLLDAAHSAKFDSTLPHCRLLFILECAKDNVSIVSSAAGFIQTNPMTLINFGGLEFSHSDTYKSIARTVLPTTK